MQAAPKALTFERFLQSLFESCFKIASLNLQRRDVAILLNKLTDKNLVKGDCEIESLEDAWGGLSTVCALYSLFCLFEAQPNNPRILIRVPEEYFDVLKGMLFYL